MKVNYLAKSKQENKKTQEKKNHLNYVKIEFPKSFANFGKEKSTSKKKTMNKQSKKTSIKVRKN